MALAGIASPWTVLVPFYPLSLSFLTKGLVKVNIHLSDRNYNALANAYHSSVPLVVLFTKFDGQIINEYVNLTDPNVEDKWGKAKKSAEITFQSVYLPKVLDAKYPPKAYVLLEGENDECFLFIM